MTVYNDSLRHYIEREFAQPIAARLEQVRDRTVVRGLPAIHIRPEEGRFLQFLVRASGGHRVIEIGSLGGYSGSWIALALPPGGKLVTIEREPLHAEVAREHFGLVGVLDRVEVRVGDAREQLSALESLGPFDFVFIDADKPSYGAYFDWALENTRVGGIIAAHNAFQQGRIGDEAQEADGRLAAMQLFNRRVATEPRVLSTIYPGGDGMIVAVKIE